MSDERIVVRYEGRDWELRQSAGEVLCSAVGRTLHHSADCAHIRGEKTVAYPDPDTLTWRRLIDSAPSGELSVRAEFAVEQGLLNVAGLPVTGTCSSCALLAVGAKLPPNARPWSLTEALAAHDRRRWRDAVTAEHAECDQVRSAFPLDAWPELPVERYALGLPEYQKSFCHLMEFQTTEMGSISGGTAAKHLIYFRRKEQLWYHDARYANVTEAWQAVRAGFVQALAFAEAGQLARVDEIEALRGGPTLVGKTLHAYFPASTLPIYSRDHVRHFIALITGAEPVGLGPFAAQARLRALIDADERFTGWDSAEIGRFLYWWNDPRPARSVVKIAPGPAAAQWQDCLDGGFICVGWDEVGDLTAFGTEQEFRAAFDDVFLLGEYKGSRAKATTKAKELWRLTQLLPGDRVVANRGTGEILGVGTVTQDGYRWRPDRPDLRHTVAVTWDTTYQQALASPVRGWAMVTVADVPDTLWRAIRRGAGTGAVAVPAEPEDSAPAGPPEKLFAAMADALGRRGQLVLFGPPGTGKTFHALRFAVWWLGGQTDLGLDTEVGYGTEEFRRALGALTAAGHFRQLTFHPAYAYEDFVGGIRPVLDGDGGLVLTWQPGVFKLLCEEATRHPDLPYLLLIDEINRGDLPKVFGELITLIEKDKRGLPVTLPQTAEPFAVPPNVYLLGTMNTADRSIRLLDSALRRRFAFLEILPDAGVLEGAMVGQLHLADVLRELNSRVLRHLGRERQIGHSYFLTSDGRPVDTEADLAAVLRDEVLPLLQEYAYDDYSLLAEFVGSKIIDRDTHQVNELGDAELLDELYTALTTSAE